MNNLAIYAGTFDPITNGHLDIIERSVNVFGRVVVAVAQSSNKKTVFTPEERKKLIVGALGRLHRNVKVEVFDGLLVDYVRKQNAKIVIRGLRAISDYEYEAQMATINSQVAPDIETVFFMTSAHSSFISSSIVREVARYGGDVSSLVPRNVVRALTKNFHSKK